MLVVANETLVGRSSSTRVRRRAERGPIRVAVVAPVTSRAPATSSTTTRAAPPPVAGSSSLAALRARGHPCARRRLRRRSAHGGEGRARAEDDRRAHRLDASGDEVRLAAQEPASTRSAGRGRPPGRARRLDVAARAGRERPRRRQRDRARRAAARPDPHARDGGPASFLIVCPQSDPRGASIRRPSAGCARRSRSSAPRASTPTGRSRIPTRSPRRWRRVEDERTDEIIVSTFPGERSGWLRRDLVGRLRAEDGLPVEHVVVEELACGGDPHDALTPKPLPRPPRRPSRAAEGQPELARRRAHARHVPVHRLGDRCSSARSSPPTSSSASSTRTRPPVAAGAVPVPRLRRRGEHGDPRHLELHDALGGAVDQARQPRRRSSPGWC